MSNSNDQHDDWPPPEDWEKLSQQSQAFWDEVASRPMPKIVPDGPAVPEASGKEWWRNGQYDPPQKTS